MGMSADAHLFYGFVVEPEYDDETYERVPHPLHDDEDGGWFYDVSDFLAAQDDSNPSPWTEIPEIANGYGRETEEAFAQWKRDNPDWEVRKDAWHEWKHGLGGDSPVAFEHYSHYDGEENPIYIRVLGPDEFGGDCWSATEIDPAGLEVDPANVERARAWCEEHNIPWQQPQWLLMASYG